MTIWQHADLSRNPIKHWKSGQKTCYFCNSSLFGLAKQDIPWLITELNGIYICPYCGWWKAEFVNVSVGPDQYTKVISAATASLRELDLTDITSPLEEVKTYLIAKYDSRKTINPLFFEEVVASVFSNIGYETIVVGKSNEKDCGIDIIMHKNNETVGVQVKRYINQIKAEQIRSLAGALLYRGLTKGVFVTTSDFQSGVYDTVSTYKERGYAIELFDAEAFYDALKLSQIKNINIAIGQVDKQRVLKSLVEVERTYEANPHGP